MKKLILFGLALCLSVPAFAGDNVTIVRDSDAQVRRLPGNTTIVTGNGGGPSDVLIQGDEDIARTMLLGPRVRVYGAPKAYGGAGGAFNDICGGDLSNHERNRCLRDTAKAQERIRKRYND